jgi:carbamoyltransferase
MNILGLHFGHDAGVSVLIDGRVAACVLRERHSRVKHAISLEFKNIEVAVASAGLRLDQIDYCAITSTQNIELIMDDAQKWSVSFDRHPNHVVPGSVAGMFQSSHIDPATRQVHSLLDIFSNPLKRDSYLYHHYGHFFPEHRQRKPSDFCRFGWIDSYIHSNLWKESTLGEIAASNFNALLNDDATRHGFHYPVTIQLAGRAVAGYFIAHHMAHAASTYYQSGFDNAAILTHDGYGPGAGYLSGMLFWAEREKIFPLTPHHLGLGALYEWAGVQLGLGMVGAPGKLMGLAAYGNPRFFDRAFVGNWFDWAKIKFGAEQWSSHCLRLACDMGYDLRPLADPNKMTAPINVDIAASTQKLLEEGLLSTVEALHKILGRAGRKTANLCMSGGTALNCPANSRIYREGRFPHVFVEPGCDDSGLAIGAATFLYHNVLGQPLPPRSQNSGAPSRALDVVGSAPRTVFPGAQETVRGADPTRIAHGYLETGASAYLGVAISEDRVKTALEAAASDVSFESCEDAADSAAQDLSANRIIGWYEGRSEIGPRALGHRSILADPRHAENWPRANRLKGREPWRPFAPAVLESEAARWFHGAPNPSPFMLFTATVRSSALPAITHADGTARIQTVDAATGEFHRVIERFFAKTGVPVILNTSFNGPGEPIIETPEEAIKFLLGSSLDALYLGEYRVTRRR